MAEKTEETPKPVRNRKKIIIISLIVLIIFIAIGIAAFFLLKNSTFFDKEGSESIPPVAEIAPGSNIGPMIDIDEFIVNIISADNNHYVKASLTLELSTEQSLEEIQKRMPQTRDAILLLLGNKTYEELQDLQGKNQLKAELMNRINSFLETGKVKSIYYTNFVVQ